MRAGEAKLRGRVSAWKLGLGEAQCRVQGGGGEGEGLFARDLEILEFVVLRMSRGLALAHLSRQ